MEITCQVCSFVYTNDDPMKIPRNLNCGHAFCTGCLMKLVRSNAITCPFRCPAKTAVSDGVDNLPKSFGILDILRSRDGGVSGGQFRTQPLHQAPSMGDQWGQQFSTSPARTSLTDRNPHSPASSFGGDGRPPPFNPAAAAAAMPSDGQSQFVPPYPVPQMPPMPPLPAMYPLPYPPYPNSNPMMNPPYPNMGSGALPPYPNPAIAIAQGISSRGSTESFSNSPRSKSPNSNPNFHVIRDNYRTLEEVQQALRRAGLESSNLIVAIDFTKSNTWTGEHTFQGRSLHWIDPTGRELNPYQSVCTVIGRTLQSFDDDNLIPAFGFGDRTTGDRSCFPFFADGSLCVGFEGVVRRYNEIAPQIVLAGPTNFAPVIREAIKITAESKSYHILLIVADGQVTSKRDTENAIVEASHHPLSIIVVGVGDGPWDVMEEFDDGLPERAFDNFQFVDYHGVQQNHAGPGFDAAFATAALMEIPEQYQAIKELELL